MKRTIIAALLIAAALAGCVEDDDKPQVRFETSLGEFTVELWPDEAPVTVENFLRYVDAGHYDGLTFHRIAPGFVVQGGGYLPDHQTLRPTNPPIVNEAKADVPNEKGTLSMARTQNPDSATSQFFINLDDNANLDKSAGSAGYAVFGEVIEGWDVVEAMTEVEEGQSFGAGGFYPAEPIIIEKATIIQGEAPEPLPAPGPAEITTDVITPGTWHVTNTEEAILAYAINTGESPGDITWDLTGADGGDLPAGWNVTIDDTDATVQPDGSATTMLRLQVPEDASGEHILELHTGMDTATITVDVQLDGEYISQAGDRVIAYYRGICTADGEEFEDGEFPLTLGAGRAIVGFDLGLIGLALNEEATLVLPAQVGYGSNGGPCASLEHAGMTFEVQILEFSEDA